MKSSAVTTEKQGDIWVVTLNRPEVRNAVDSPTALALHAAFLAFDDDPDAEVAVFHGANGHFCAGWDLQYGARLAASGGSGGLDQLDFDANDPRGLGHAMDLILTGRQVDAAEALRIGLANRVVPSGTARDAAIALAQQLAAFPQATMRADRESAFAQWDLPLGEALQQEWQRGKARIPDALEGATRFAQGQGRHGRFP